MFCLFFKLQTYSVNAITLVFFTIFSLRPDTCSRTGFVFGGLGPIDYAQQEIFQIKTALLNLPVSVLAICVVVVYRFPVGFSVICNPMGDFLSTSKEKKYLGEVFSLTFETNVNLHIFRDYFNALIKRKENVFPTV